jgi:hypothetical protein
MIDGRTIEVANRPYTIDFGTPGGQYPLSSEEVRNLLSERYVKRVQANLLTLPAENGMEGTVRIRPSTLGGGSSFTV